MVSFHGHDVPAEYASLRSRIGVVPQDDVVHRQLTVEQALGYAAELRLPPDTMAADRRQVVARCTHKTCGSIHESSAVTSRFMRGLTAWNSETRWRHKMRTRLSGGNH